MNGHPRVSIHRDPLQAIIVSTDWVDNNGPLISFGIRGGAFGGGGVVLEVDEGGGRE